MSKVDRAVHGPGWAEVIFGAILSLILGVVLGAVLLVLRPAVVAKEIPKEPVKGAVYYVEGLRGDSSSAREALLKRKAFVEGQSVKVTEREINALASAAASAPAAKADPSAAAETVTPGTPNVRIREGVMQVGVPVKVNVLGIEQTVIAQARGNFERKGDIYTFEPTEMYLGSCPVQRLPFLSAYLRDKVLSSQKIPEDIAASWAKLASVSIEGNTLNLSME